MPDRSIHGGAQDFGGAPVNRAPAALLDFDGVLRQGFVLWDFATFLNDSGQFHAKQLDDLVSLQASFNSGEVSYEMLAELAPTMYSAGLRGYSAPAHAKLARDYVASSGFSVRVPDTTAVLLKFLGALGISRIILSGAPHSVLSELRSTWRVEGVAGIRPMEVSGVFSGELLDNPATMERKAELVADVLKEFDPLIAFGDSTSDLPLLRPAAWKVVIGRLATGTRVRDDRVLAIKDIAAPDAVQRLRAFLEEVK